MQKRHKYDDSKLDTFLESIESGGDSVPDEGYKRSLKNDKMN